MSDLTRSIVEIHERAIQAAKDAGVYGRERRLDRRTKDYWIAARAAAARIAAFRGYATATIPELVAAGWSLEDIRQQAADSPLDQGRIVLLPDRVRRLAGGEAQVRL